MSTKWVGWAAAAAVTVGLVSAANAKTLVYCSEGSPEGFNPQFYSSGTTFDATSRPIFNRLIEFETGTTKVIPGLAQSWSVSEDGLVYTFKLRPGVKWHTTRNFTPTRDFNADDVLFSFERQWKDTHPFHKVSPGVKYEYFNSKGMPKLLKSIEKVDDLTVRMTLNTPFAPMIASLGMDFASIHSAEYADKMLKAGTPEKVDLDPVGTGPFVFQSYQKDAVIRYKAHPTYWEGKAKIDDLVYAITPDASVRWAKIKSGECHVMPYPNPADLAAMKQDANVQLMEQEGLNVGYLAFNVEKKPFDNKLVRQAVNYAINKKAIIDAVYLGAGVAAKNPMPPSIWSYHTGIQDYAHDPAKAKALLAQAGLPNGFETDLWAMPVQRPYNPNAKRMAEIMQADLDKVGIKAKIVTYEWAEYLKRTREGEHQMMMLGWTGDNGDPDNFLAELLGCDSVGGNNRARWCNKDFEALIQQAKKIPDQAKRAPLYMKAQEVFKEEVPWVTVAHSVVFKPVRKEVTGYKIHPFGGHIFYGVDVK
jgi:dipeptide transport system substrate-binding protein